MKPLWLIQNDKTVTVSVIYARNSQSFHQVATRTAMGLMVDSSRYSAILRDNTPYFTDNISTTTTGSLNIFFNLSFSSMSLRFVLLENVLTAWRTLLSFGKALNASTVDSFSKMGVTPWMRARKLQQTTNTVKLFNI